MSKPRLLDAYCSAGGATRGYQLAGFHVTGVDLVASPNYVGDDFHQGDAIEFIDAHGHEFDAIAASPPCELYMLSGLPDKAKHPDLLPPTREALERTGKPWVIENVPGAPMRADALLCGSMFGLTVRRHRWFEFSDGRPRFAPAACDHSRRVVGVYGHPHGTSGAAPGMLPGTLATWSEGLGIDWMTAPELALAIPPAFAEWIGRQLLSVLEEAP